MALESGTFIQDLVETNPPGTDPKSQGDDHLRLLKDIVKNTFPNASRAFYFEDVPAAKTGAYTIVASDEHALIRGDASGGAFTITLPTLASVFAGFSVAVMKSDSSANAVTVDGNGAETINGAASRSLDEQYDVEIYMSDGAEWKVLSPQGAEGALAAKDTVGTADIDNDAVDNTKLANMAQATVKGRASGAGTGDPVDLTDAQLDAILAASVLATVSQAEAEAGTATTRRVWTAQRVAQAIAALASGGLTVPTATTLSSQASSTISGIPAGTAQVIVSVHNIIPNNSTFTLRVRVGTSGGVATTGYDSVSGSTYSSAMAAQLAAFDASSKFFGKVIFTLVDATNDIWSFEGRLHCSDGGADIQTADISGTVDLSADLDRVEISTPTNLMTSGTWNVAYQ